jgi:hypothetical protein
VSDLNAGLEAQHSPRKPLGFVPQPNLRNYETGLPGVSSTSLRQFRVFYIAYREIRQALPVKSLNEDARILLLLLNKQIDIESTLLKMDIL